MTDYVQQRNEKSTKRLRAALDKPLPATAYEIGVDGFFDPWCDIVDGMVGAYSAEIDQVALDVLRSIRDRTTFEGLKGDRALAFEIMLHIFSDWLCEYGRSPRGCFPCCEAVELMFPELIGKWEAWAKLRWQEDFA